MKLPLAVTLALACANAMALGLGPIQVKSGLNQPLLAEIAVSGTPDETAGLAVALASAADFERVGLSRARVGTPLEFSVVPGAKGGAVIRISSKEAVHDPFLDFLVEVNWAKGKLLREYTVLLDPPVSAPAVKGSSAKMTPVKEAPAAASARPLEPSKPSRAPRAETAPATAAASSPTPSTPPKAPRAAQSGEYGPVNTGEALWDIANATKPDASVSIDQMMLALLRNNPGAFYQDNINSLKRGAILRVPSSEEIKSAGSASAAAAEVKAQTEAWRSGSAAMSSKPTLVADTGAAPSKSASTSTTTSTKPGDKLALVPPKAGSGSQATGSTGAAGGGTGDGAARAELARTKEALASREQESGELKSRVKELEELKTKNERLLSLKDSELAELQKKLKELQDKTAKTPAGSTTATVATATPSSTTTTTATPSSSATSTAAATATPSTSTAGTKPSGTTPAGAPNGLTKEDIWGSAASDAGTKPSGTTSVSNASSTASTTATPSTATTAPSSTSTTTTATPSTCTTPSATTSATPGDSATSTTPSTASTTPSGTTTPGTSTTTPAATATTPSSTTSAAKPATPAKVQPLTPAPAEEPWYKKTWLLAAAGLGLLAVVVLALLNVLRRPKKAPAAPAAPLPLVDTAQDEEHDLLDRLALQPDDTAAHLELVSLYYARQDVEKFEDAAQAMYAHLGEHEAAEWEQVKAMGQELAPHNPLFSQDVAGHGYDTTPSHHASSSAFDAFEDVHTSIAPPPPAPAAAHEDPFDFDLTDHSAAPPPPAPAAPARPAPVEDFTLTMPAMNFDKDVRVEPVRVPEPVVAAPSVRVDEDFGIGSEDATGTKLDLAKAYLDMGDPEGARSMLEEVVAEGTAAQKAEANKLLKELR